MSAVSPFSSIPIAPPDPILGLTEAFNKDTNPSRVNLGVGVYQDSSGKVPILKSVHLAEERWLQTEPTKSYIPIDGAANYNSAVRTLLFGEGSDVIADGRSLTVQALGGTGALKIGADFLKRFFPEAEVYISTPSWENHRALFEAAGFKVNAYRYYDGATKSLDFDGMCEDFSKIPNGNIVLLHACCHNPSGVDLDPVNWQAVVDICRDRGLIPFLDFAYQGFGEGIDEDACAVRTFAASGLQFLIANSFSKSFSLYRERVGALTIVTSCAEESARLLSQVKRVIRTNYSSPASHGGQVVAIVLNDEALCASWKIELQEMRERIWAMRSRFVAELAARGVERDFSFIQKQKGMFSFAGMTVEQVHRLRSEYSLYIVDSSRICVAALNDNNIAYVCDAIANVLNEA